MKLYKAKIPAISRDILRRLTDAGLIQVVDRDEADADIQSVLNEYVRLEREITEKAKDLLEARGLPYEEFGRTKRLMADEAGIGLGREGIIWMCNQILETFMQSTHIEEIFAPDSELRRKMEDIIRRHMLVDEELDAEVRQRIRNLQEGSASWDIEYQKVMDQIKRKRGIQAE